MKANAIEAARAAGVPLLAIRRPAWVQREGDRWIMVESLEAAAAAIGEEPRRVFLTTGRMELAPFRSAPQHFYIVRSVEAPSPEDLPPRVELITARGPFNLADERALLEDACDRHRSSPRTRAVRELKPSSTRRGRSPSP